MSAASAGPVAGTLVVMDEQPPLTSSCDDCCAPAPRSGSRLHRGVGTGLLVAVAAIVAGAAVAEWLGILDAALDAVPWWLAAVAVVAGGWPVFMQVGRAAWERRVTGHTLMTLGVVAAGVVGEWRTAVLIVFFMRFAETLEAHTNRRSHQAIRDLAGLAPTVARVRRGADEVEVPVDDVRPGDLVVIRPGERIPVDGEVWDGTAPVDEAAITGESIPVDKASGDRVYAATVCQAGALVVRALRTGEDTTFGRILHLVEEAQTRRAPVQRFADRFATYYIPVVLAVAAATVLLTGEVLRGVAVMVVACACAIVIATPVVVVASAGAAARRGLIVKGGLTLERLARVDTVVVDKTGTLTHARIAVTDVVPLRGATSDDVLALAAAAEAPSEHPVARALVAAAHTRGLRVAEATSFAVRPGRGVVATVDGHAVAVGNRTLLAEQAIPPDPEAEATAALLEQTGRTVSYVAVGTTVVGTVAVADEPRADAAAAIGRLRRMGIGRVLMLTGDNEQAAAAIAAPLGIEWRAGLLPEDKITIVRELQHDGRVVLMVGDGINDAPALAQADVGAAMGIVGTDAALEAADLGLAREDWDLVPAAIDLGRRAARTIRQNLWFTALYNATGVTLAALGILPPVAAAAAQSLPDMAILGNSARLLRGPKHASPGPPRRSDAQEDLSPVEH